MPHYIREYFHSIGYIISGSYNHILNNHRPVIEEQYIELCELGNAI